MSSIIFPLPNGTIPTSTNSTSSSNLSNLTHLISNNLSQAASSQYAPLFWYIVLPILVALGMFLFYRYMRSRPRKPHVVKPVSKILYEEQLQDTEVGGLKPSNATLMLNNKDIYKIFWYDPAYEIPEIKIEIEEPRPTGLDRRHPKRQPYRAKTKAVSKPLVCYYVRVKSIRTLFERMFPRWVKFEFLKLPRHKMDATFNSKGELDFLTCKTTIYLSSIGGTRFDREYSAQLRENNLDASYWKATHLGSLAKFADASKQESIIGSPLHAQRLNEVEEKGDADVDKVLAEHNMLEE